MSGVPWVFFYGGVNEHGILEGTGGDGGGFSLSLAQSSEVLILALARLWKAVGSLSVDEGIRVSNKHLFEAGVLRHIAQSELKSNQELLPTGTNMYLPQVLPRLSPQSPLSSSPATQLHPGDVVQWDATKASKVRERIPRGVPDVSLGAGEHTSTRLSRSTGADSFLPGR